MRGSGVFALAGFLALCVSAAHADLRSYCAAFARDEADQALNGTAILNPKNAKPLSGDAMAPGGLGFLGESGNSAMGVIIVVERIDEFDEAFDWESHETMREARSLFPEAHLAFGVVETNPDSSPTRQNRR
jgi:hypothetical protein